MILTKYGNLNNYYFSPRLILLVFEKIKLLLVKIYILNCL